MRSPAAAASTVAFHLPMAMRSAPAPPEPSMELGMEAPEPEERAVPPSPMLRLVSLQRADGRWELGPELAACLGQSEDTLRDLLRRALGLPARADVPGDAASAWATALALAWLERHAQDDAVAWSLVARKGKRWLKGAPAAPAGRDWRTWAEKVVSA